MSTAIFPALPGLGWSAKRTPIWKTRTSEAESGKEARFTYWSAPRWQYELTFNGLRQGTRRLGTFAEFASLAGFFNARQGGFDSFLYQDIDDNAVTGQAIGQGDGATTSFQLVRAFGGFIEPILAPNVVSAIYLGGVAQSPSSYTVNAWGSAAPGAVAFTAAPGAGIAITADFTFYFPCRFGTAQSSGVAAEDTIDFEKFMATLYRAKSVKFISIK